MHHVVFPCSRPLAVLACCVSVVLAGCYAAGRKVDQQALEQFQEGITTYEQVVEALGPPTNSVLNSNKTRQLLYVYTQTQAHLANFIPGWALISQGASSEQTTVQLDFDARKILTGYSATTGNMQIGTGLSSGKKQ
jgi:outer membrane protein assembly factor BamE (lipoprotein component of BamABCDE complex)